MSVQVDEVFSALGDPTRRAILERLRQGPRAVGDIAAGLSVSRPAVSQHLKVLKGAGLVREYADGRRRFYSIDVQGLTALRSYLDSFWDDALAAFARHVQARRSPHQPSGGGER